jgi:hypothetical protein
MHASVVGSSCNSGWPLPYAAGDCLGAGRRVVLCSGYCVGEVHSFMCAKICVCQSAILTNRHHLHIRKVVRFDHRRARQCSPSPRLGTSLPPSGRPGVRIILILALNSNERAVRMSGLLCAISFRPMRDPNFPTCQTPIARGRE